MYLPPSGLDKLGKALEMAFDKDKDEFKPMFQSCEEMINTYDKPKWGDLTEHVITFSNCQ